MRNPSRQDTGRRRRALLFGGIVVALIAVRVIAVALILRDGIDNPLSILGGDARRYLRILDTPGTPYLDFPVEYPPLSLAFTHLVQGADLFATQVRLSISQLLLELVVAGAIAWAWGRRTGFAYLLLGTPMALYPFPYFRIDLLAVALAVIGLALVRRGRPNWGGSVLGLAIFAKIWPAVLLPWLAVRRSWRALAAAGVTLAAGALAWVVWAGIDGPIQVATFRGAHGWQIESVIGVFVHLADPAGTAVEQGAWRTAVEVPVFARFGLPILALGTAAAAWALAERSRRQRRADTEVVVDGWAPLAAVMSLLVFSSIISPQYLVWATPFAAIVVVRAAKWQARLAGGLFLAAGLLSALGLAFIHALTRGEHWAIGLVAGRNALLVAILGVAFWGLLRQPHGSGGEDRSPEERSGASNGHAERTAPLAGAQATPKAMIATMSDTEATRSIDDVISGMP